MVRAVTAASHGVEIVGEVDQRHGHGLRLVAHADVVVDDERGVGEDHLVALFEKRVAEQHEQLAGTVADRHLAWVAIVVQGKRGTQVGGVPVGIAIELVERSDDRLLHFVERGQRELIGGQLDDLAEAESPHHELERLARLVGHHPVKCGNEAHGLLR